MEQFWDYVYDVKLAREVSSIQFSFWLPAKVQYYTYIGICQNMRYFVQFGTICTI